jgi:hypothetical protein
VCKWNVQMRFATAPEPGVTAATEMLATTTARYRRACIGVQIKDSITRDTWTMYSKSFDQILPEEPRSANSQLREFDEFCFQDMRNIVQLY